MEARLTLKPGQKGTKKLLEQYGDRLICVRYKYDKEKKKRYKTIELIIDETDWEPPVNNAINDAIVGIKVSYDEKEIQEQLRNEGGLWDRQKKLWFIKHEKVIKMGLEQRIVA
ncbi:MAG: hypothetical protein HQK77_17205 [Desulfobacterales bacterium]|nr:hypothetical protein [Desulfobacterales bacterium]